MFRRPRIVTQTAAAGPLWAAPASEPLAMTAPDRRPRLESLEPRRLLATFTVTGTGDAGAGTLRDAIDRANRTPGADTIAFDIPGDGPLVIRPASPLPEIADPIVIDGYSEPGARPNDRAVGTDAVLRVVLDGRDAVPGLAASSVSGLVLRSTDSVVRGLVIQHFSGAGIELYGDADRVEGNFLGTDAAGAAAAGNGTGVAVVGGSSNTIGGTDPASRNLISGNRGAGVSIEDIISIRYIRIALLNELLGDLIGTDATGAAALGNGGDGVDDASGKGAVNTVGGAAAGAGNVIAFNGEAGIAASAIEVRGNAIFSNGGLGIDLVDTAGPNPPATGGYPTLTAADPVAGGVRVRGTLDRAPMTDYRVEFFADAGDPSGYGEGRLPLGAATVTTGADGKAAIDTVLPAPPADLPAITATATPVVVHAVDDFVTSEFSPIAGISFADLATTLAAVDRPYVLTGVPTAVRVTVTNNGPSPATGVRLALAPGDPSAPATFSGVAVDDPGATVTGQGTDAVEVAIGDLAVGASVTLTVAVDGGPLADGTFPAVVLVATTASDQADPAGPPSTELSLPIDPHDLRLATPGLPAHLRTGHQVSIPFTITNDGPAAAAMPSLVVESTTLGANLRIVSITPGTPTTGTTPGVTFGRLDPGGSVSGTLTVLATRPGPGDFTIVAEDLKNPNDPNGGNDRVATQYQVVDVPADVDGDGIGDRVTYAYDPAAGSGRFTVALSGGGTREQMLGGPDDAPVIADFDGDGEADLGVYGYSPDQGYSRFAAVLSGGGTMDVGFGGRDDLPAIGDYNGDGRADVAVYGYSPDNGYSRFAILPGAGMGDAYAVPFGGAGDLPAVGDYDGDGEADVAVYGYSPDDGYSRFAILPSSGGSAYPVAFGGGGDAPIPAADYDGDGKADVAVYGYSPDNGYSRFAILPSGGGSAYSVAFGGGLDAAVAADLDGDGATDVVVHGPYGPDGAGRFAVIDSSDGAARTLPGGAAGSIALPAGPMALHTASASQGARPAGPLPAVVPGVLEGRRG